MYALNYYSNTIFIGNKILKSVVIIFVMSDATVLTRYCFFLFSFSFLLHVFLSYVLSLICEAVLCLELVFAELGQAHYNFILFYYYGDGRGLCAVIGEDELGLCAMMDGDGCGLCAVMDGDGCGLCAVMGEDGRSLCKIMDGDGRGLCAVIAVDGRGLYATMDWDGRGLCAVIDVACVR